MSVQIGLSVKSPHPEIATAHPNGKIQVFTFAVPPPEAQRARAGTEVAEKFFEKVRSSLDGQGKCVKIFLGNGEGIEYLLLPLPQSNQNAFTADSQDRPARSLFQKNFLRM